MIKFKKIIVNAIIIILIALSIFVIINSLLKKDYTPLIRFLSAFIGYLLFHKIDLKVVVPLRTRVIKQDLFNVIIWSISIIIFITNFLLSILIKDSFIKHAIEGLIYPLVYYSVKYCNIWMEDDETDSNKS